MTYQVLIDRLAAAGIDNAAGEARLLAAHFAGLDENVLRIHPDHSIPDPEGVLLRALERREMREPLQYILGTWSFWRQEYEVSPDCLVPRPDTECLVEEALRHLPRGGRILDLCTGSGCIAISLLCERADASCVALELSEPTLALAKRNAARNGVGNDRLTLLCGDVLIPDFLPTLGKFDIIISNPPYIPTADLAALPPETQREPRMALDGGEDGLRFYRRILAPDYRTALKAGGCFLFEIGYDQGEALRTLAASIGADCRITRDYGGNDRVAWVTWDVGALPQTPVKKLF
ncbi:MAG: peptide chain release factor N(5)-glutamine methyltransferase [Clostridia bacterium]|nr:peptide chain release factor N(5)-glutamine methyltransferase [Clostridia bacterium]